uniref:polynucleotide adenylyltransferase n=1 Tax=Globodera rostochiensis TaxID=31243 RepID=A0A914IC63_GLORO
MLMNEPENSSINSNLQLLHLGIYANEIFNRKLDKDFFELYKSDQFLKFDDNKSRKTNIDLYQIVHGWQQIDFNEAMAMNMKSTNVFKNVCKINEQTEKDTNETFDAIKELRKIFQFWSDEARFQMPALHYLKPNNKTLKPICMLPDGFDLITKIFGSFQCNLNEAQMCRDNSLYCILCGDPRVKFLQKHSTVNIAFVPKLEIYFMATHFMENFDAQQIQIFLYGFGKKLKKLINENYSDEGAYEFDPKKKAQLKRQLEEDVFMAEDDEQILRMLEKIEKLNKNEEPNKIESMDFNEYKANAQANLKKNKEKMEEMKANLTVLWHHALHLKILELLLTKKELYRINHHQFDKDVMNGSTLLNFRIAYAYLELWAKKAQIFNEKFGHFNSQIIIIMLTKVFLWFPGDVSVAFLVEKFFLIYAIWDWPLPLHLTKIDYTKEGEFMSWSTEREWFDKMQENNGQQFSFEMPIISPMFPEQNLANRIDAFEAKKIQNEFLNAIKRIKVMNAGAVTKNKPLKEDIFT